MEVATFILIAWFNATDGAAAFSAEFNSKASCESAASALLKEWVFRRRFYGAICVPK